MEEAGERIKINKLAILLLSTFASVLGFLPLALLLQRPSLLLYIAGLAALVTLVNLTLDSIATEKPGLAEFLLAGWGAIAYSGLFSLLWMIVYGILYGILSLVFLLFRTSPDPDTIAFYISLVPGMIGAFLGNSGGSYFMITELYPNEVGIKSAFYEYVTQGRRKIFTWTVIIIAIFSGILWWFLYQGGTGIWFYIASQILILVFCFPVATMKVRTHRSNVQLTTTKVSTLLKQLGYHVKEFPRAYNAEYDVWLVNLDLCAQRDGQHLLVQIIDPADVSDTVDWTTISSFMTAATVWIQYQSETEQNHIGDRALLMILMDGVQEDNTFVVGAERENVGILHLSQDALTQALQAASELGEQPIVQQLREATAQAMTSPKMSRRE